MGVALYFIDRLALRAGHEKDDDEADTVGCCTLKVRVLRPPHAQTRCWPSAACLPGPWECQRSGLAAGGRACDACRAAEAQPLGSCRRVEFPTAAQDAQHACERHSPLTPAGGQRGAAGGRPHQAGPPGQGQDAQHACERCTRLSPVELCRWATWSCWRTTASSLTSWARTACATRTRWRSTPPCTSACAASAQVRCPVACMGCCLGRALGAGAAGAPSCDSACAGTGEVCQAPAVLSAGLSGPCRQVWQHW